VAEPRRKNDGADVAAAAGRKVIGSVAGRRKKRRSAHGERRTKDGNGAPWRCGERRGHNSKHGRDQTTVSVVGVVERVTG